MCVTSSRGTWFLKRKKTNEEKNNNKKISAWDFRSRNNSWCRTQLPEVYKPPISTAPSSLSQQTLNPVGLQWSTDLLPMMLCWFGGGPGRPVRADNRPTSPLLLSIKTFPLPSWSRCRTRWCCWSCLVETTTTATGRLPNERRQKRRKTGQSRNTWDSPQGLRGPSGPSTGPGKEATVCKHVMGRYTTQQQLEADCTVKNTTSKPVKQAGWRHRNLWKHLPLRWDRYNLLTIKDLFVSGLVCLVCPLQYKWPHSHRRRHRKATAAVRTERSISAITTNRHQFTQKAAAVPKEAWQWRHDDFNDDDDSRCSPVLCQSDTLSRGDGGCFLGESSLMSRSGGLTIAVIYFITNTRAEMWRRVKSTDRRTGASPHISAVFFSSSC